MTGQPLGRRPGPRREGKRPAVRQRRMRGRRRVSGKEGNGTCRTVAPGPRQHEPGAPATVASGRQVPGLLLSARLPSQPTHGPKGERVEGSTVPRATTVGSTGSRRSRSPLTKRGHGRPPRRGLEGAQQCAPGTAGRPAGPGSVSPRDQQRGRQRRFSQDGGAGCAAVRIRRGPSGLLAFPANSRQDPLSRGAEGTSQCASQYRDHGYV